MPVLYQASNVQGIFYFCGKSTQVLYQVPFQQALKGSQKNSNTIQKIVTQLTFFLIGTQRFLKELQYNPENCDLTHIFDYLSAIGYFLFDLQYLVTFNSINFTTQCQHLAQILGQMNFQLLSRPQNSKLFSLKGFVELNCPKPTSIVLPKEDSNSQQTTNLSTPNQEASEIDSVCQMTFNQGIQQNSQTNIFKQSAQILSQPINKQIYRQQIEQQIQAKQVGQIQSPNVQDKAQQKTTKKTKLEQAGFIKFQKVKLSLNTLKPAQHNVDLMKTAIKKELKKQAEVTTIPNYLQRQAKKKKNKVIQIINLIDQSESQIEICTQIVNKSTRILQSVPLRYQFADLLPKEHQYIIGEQHKKLIRVLKAIDSAVSFASNTRKVKGYFFSDLKNILYQNLRLEVTKEHIQQLLFLDPDVYKVQWTYNQNRRYIALLVTLPDTKLDPEERAERVKKNLVCYLLEKEAQLLAANKLKKTKSNGWQEGFNPNEIQIPLMDLPIYPLLKDAPQTEKTKKRLKCSKSQENQLVDDKCSEEVMKMIFSNQSNEAIKERIYKQILKKQARLPKYPTGLATLDNQMLVNVCDEVVIACMGPKVTHVFKSSMMERLNKKFGYNYDVILDCMKIILDAPNQFVREIMTKNKIVIYEINFNKYHETIRYLQQKNLD